MTQATEQRSAVLPVVFLLLVFVNIGLVVWWWNQKQARPAGYSASGLNLSSPPPPPAAAPAPAEPLPDAAGTGVTSLASPARNFIQDPELAYRGPKAGAPASSSGAVAGGPAAAPGGPQGAGSDPDKARPQTRQLVAAASREYFKLKKDPFFKASPTIRQWIREFRAHADLRAIDDRYNKDKDGVRFLVHMVRSENFKLMLDRHFQAPDIQAFIKTMTASPTVMASARSFMADFNVPAAVRRYAASGAAAGTSGTASPAPAQPPSGATAVERLRSNPALQKYLDPSGAQAIPGGQ